MAKVMNMMVSIGNEVIGENDTGDDEAGMDSGGYGGYDRPAAHYAPSHLPWTLPPCPQPLALGDSVGPAPSTLEVK